MGGLLAYSGIATKVRAMERYRISSEQFREMRESESVPEAVEYLRKFPPYRSIFEGLGEADLHRGNIEQLLNITQYLDFMRLYQFANMKQRDFLDLYFLHYEIGIVKSCLHNLVGKRRQDIKLGEFRAFFDRRSRLDLKALSESQNLDEFVASLKGSICYPVLNQLIQKRVPTLPECETALDMLHFSTMWKVRSKHLSKKEKDILTQCFGTRLDTLNLQWIYRAKKYYHMTAAQVYAILIPIRLHLRKEEINRMVDAADADEFLHLLRESFYGKLKNIDIEGKPELDSLMNRIVDRIYLLTSRKDPYSIAILNSYLYFKEREENRIITTIEQIRYGVSIN